MYLISYVIRINVVLYLLIHSKSNQFFFPYWLKRSLGGFMTLLSILLMLNLLNDKIETNTSLDNIDEKITLVQYRYIKELSSIYFLLKL